MKFTNPTRRPTCSILLAASSLLAIGFTSAATAVGPPDLGAAAGAAPNAIGAANAAAARGGTPPGLTSAPGRATTGLIPNAPGPPASVNPGIDVSVGQGSQHANVHAGLGGVSVTTSAPTPSSGSSPSSSTPAKAASTASPPSTTSTRHTTASTRRRSRSRTTTRATRGGTRRGAAGVAGAIAAAGPVPPAIGTPPAATPRLRVRRPVHRLAISAIVARIPPSLRWPLVVVAWLAALFAALSLRERLGRKKAERVALADPLTGIPNRLAFEQSLAKEWSRARRYSRPLSLLLIDLDGFKQVNDQAGHAMGDRMLCQVADKLTARMRETDTLARFGGDEFVAICPETEGAGLDGLVRDLRDFKSEVGRLPVRLSIGAAQLEPEDLEPTDLLIRADKAMYEQKRARTVAAVR